MSSIAVATNSKHTDDCALLAKHLKLPLCHNNNEHGNIDHCSTFDLFLSYEPDRPVVMHRKSR
ncbi:MAG: hypothetical protein V3R49_01770, partial [Gammaproteobacteria bacterium]